MGLFKGIKDVANLTKQAKQLQEQQQADAGYKPGMGGQFQQMGDLLSNANEQLAELTDQQGDKGKLLAEGIAAQGVIVGMGTPERGAMTYNLDIDLEVHVPGRQPYRVANQYMVPAAAQLGPGVTLPIRVDPDDQAKIAIDWDQAARSPQRGQVRPADASSPSPAPAAAAPAAPSGGADTVTELERLAKLRDSGALIDSEFEQQKVRLLGG